MSDVIVSIGAETSLFRGELEKAAATLNEFIEGAELTGKILRTNLGIAEQAQKALRDQIDLTRNKQKEANAEYDRAKQAVRTANKAIHERIQILKGLSATERQRRIQTWQQSEAYKREKAAVVEAGLALRRASVEKAKYTGLLRNYENALRTVNVSTRNLKDANRQLVQSKGELGNAFKRTLGFANQIAGVFGFGLGVYGLVRAFRGAVGAIKEFDSSIRTLAAISGATADELERLSRIAIQVGGASKFGADGVAEMMTQLAKMGFAVGEIENMAQGITRLATASHEELEPAAVTVASIIRAMGMDAADTAQIVDTLALSFTQSALDLSKFRESMKYVAPLAKQANFTLEDTAAILAKLADAGVSGSLAGTSLRNVFSALADQSSALSKRLGGNIGDFDTFIQGMEDLVTAGLSTEEIFKLIDRRAVTALSTIANNTGSIVELRDRMQDANGAADEMANIQMQSIAYQAKMAGNAWNSFVLAMDKGDGVISNLIKGPLTAFSMQMNKITRAMTAQTNEMLKEVRAIELMSGVIKDTNRNFEDRMEAVRKLRNEYPDLFANMDIEVAKWIDIVDAIDGALNKKREYLRLEFMTEEITEAEIKLKYFQDRYKSLNAEARFYFETLSGAQQQKALEGLSGLAEVIDEQEESTGKLSRAMRSQLVSVVRVMSEIEKYSKILEDTSKHQRDLSAVILDSEEAVNRYYQGILQERSDMYINAMREQAQAAIDSGEGRVQAFDKATEGVIKGIEEQMAAIEKLNEKNREALELIEGSSLKEREQRAYISKAIQDNTIKHEILRQAILKVLKASEDSIDNSQEEIRLTEQQLRLDQRLAEARARIALDGIELEDELSRIRLEYANEIAKATLSGDERDKTIRLNQKQRQIDLQRIEQNRIRQTSQLEEAAHRRKIEQLNLEQQLLETEISGIGGDTPREIALNREMALIEKVTEHEATVREKNRDRELAKIEEDLQTQMLSYLRGTEERARLEQELIDQKAHINEKFRQEEILASRKAAQERQRIETQIFEEKLRYMEEERKFQMEQSDWLRQQQALELSRVDNLWQALDVFGQRSREQRDLEKQHAKEKLQEQLTNLALLEKELEARLAILITEKKAKEFMGVSTTDTEAEIAGLEEKLQKLRWTFSTVANDLRILEDPGFDLSAWDELVSALRGVAGQMTGIYQGILDERYRIAQEERALLDRRISELQRDLDLELRLNEQGFASNVQAMMAAIEQEKAARDKALQEEKKAAEEKRRLEKVLQTINLLTAVSNVIKAESTKGLVGIATAAAGLGGLWMLWGNQSSRAKQSVQTYEKGGSFLLQGKSHAQGGIPLTPRHEAQGGELVSVFNRKATQRYGSEIKSMTDAFNKGNYQYPSASSYEFDTSDIKAIRRLLESDNTTYSNGYKIIKKGNTTIRCRLN